jgi:hypothetical protein
LICRDILLSYGEEQHFPDRYISAGIKRKKELKFLEDFTGPLLSLVPFVMNILIEDLVSDLS